MQVDIKLVQEIIQDFTNKTIEIRDKQGHRIWFNSYTSETTFNKVYRTLSQKFSIELKRRGVTKWYEKSYLTSLIYMMN